MDPISHLISRRFALQGILGSVATGCLSKGRKEATQSIQPDSDVKLQQPFVFEDLPPGWKNSNFKIVVRFHFEVQIVTSPLHHVEPVVENRYIDPKSLEL